MAMCLWCACTVIDVHFAHVLCMTYCGARAHVVCVHACTCVHMMSQLYTWACTCTYQSIHIQYTIDRDGPQPQVSVTIPSSTIYSSLHTGVHPTSWCAMTCSMATTCGEGEDEVGLRKKSRWTDSSTDQRGLSGAMWTSNSITQYYIHTSHSQVH